MNFCTKIFCIHFLRIEYNWWRQSSLVRLSLSSLNWIVDYYSHHHPPSSILISASLLHLAAYFTVSFWLRFLTNHHQLLTLPENIQHRLLYWNLEADTPEMKHNQITIRWNYKLLKLFKWKSFNILITFFLGAIL